MPSLLHPLKPIISAHSKVLILGSFPSIASREKHFYYAHPRNRFWPIMQALFQTPKLQSQEQKIALLHTHKIALFDMVKECHIHRSLDASLQVLAIQPLEQLIQQTAICHIFTNGKKAHQIYSKHFSSHPLFQSLLVECLPSTSSANAAYSFEALLEQWSKIKQALSQS